MIKVNNLNWELSSTNNILFPSQIIQRSSDKYICAIQCWKLDVTLDMRSNLVWICLILCYLVSWHALFDTDILLPCLQKRNVFRNDHKGAPLFPLHFNYLFFLSDCFRKIRNMLHAVGNLLGNLEKAHLVWVPWQTYSCRTCLHSAFI